MDTKTLLTISKLSNLTGVHIKALRYYDSIGILPPTYVDPNNNYRYYSAIHIYLVEAIRLCAEMNIPLKQFEDYISSEGSKIQLAKIIKVGTELTEKKLETINGKLSLLNELKKEIERAERIRKSENPYYIKIEKTDYWLVPYQKDIATSDFYWLLEDTVKKVKKEGLEPVFDNGLLLITEGENVSRYLYLALKKDVENKNYEQVISIEEKTYECKITDDRDILNAQKLFQRRTSSQRNKYLFLVETFPETFDLTSIFFEARLSTTD